MKGIKKLPDSEFEIMKIVWESDPPITAKKIGEALDNEWKAQTILTLLHRLVEKGFLDTEKSGKERVYMPKVDGNEYLEFETGNFLGKFHNNSLTGLMNTLYDGKNMTEDDVDELIDWIKSKK